MTDPLTELPRMSVDEYLAFEEASDVKHEYVEGFVYAMSGAHSRHERIAGNVFANLWIPAQGGPCRVYGSNLKIRVGERRFYYPDAMSVCTPRDDDGLMVGDPCVLVEVTSPSTSRTDHREKLDAYRAIVSLRAYLIVEQNRREVHCWSRPVGGEWGYALHVEQGAIGVPCPERVLTLDEIYSGVTMPPARARRVREPEPAYDE